MNVNVQPASIHVDASKALASATIGAPVVKEYVEAPVYRGEYEITPTEETQILSVDGMRMIHDLIIKPIPSDYGRVTWNGAYLLIE